MFVGLFFMWKILILYLHKMFVTPDCITGSIQHGGWQCGRSTQSWPSLGIADTCQSVEELTRRVGKEVTPQMGSGSFSHQFGLRSAYNHSRHQDTRVPVGGYEVRLNLV